MDVRYFLLQRTAFIRQLYETSTAPYQERIQKINAKEAPWTAVYNDDSDEPPYLEEWIEADESLQVIGANCLSMLSAALKIYLQTWEQLIRNPFNEDIKRIFKSNGWLQGYRAYFLFHTKIDFHNAPINLLILEELILARNRSQHPESITTQRSSYSENDLKKISHPYFSDSREVEIMEATEDENNWLMPPTIRVTKEKLFAALIEVEQFSAWLETADHESSPPLGP